MGNPSETLADLGIGADVNFVPVSNVYPRAGGGTLAGAGSALNLATTVGVPGEGPAVAATPPTIPGGGSPHTIWYWLGLVVLFAITVWASKRAGGADDFKNIRPTFYNFLTITLTALLGLVGLKVIFNRVRVPGISDIVNAA